MATHILQCLMQSDLVTLYPLEEKHRDEMYLAASDPLIWEQHPSHDRWKKEVFYDFFDNAIKGNLAFAVVDRATHKIIGSSRYKLHHIEKTAVEIGWTFLARSHWGGKWNGEMKRLMIQNAHTYFSGVLLCIGDSNLRSARAAEKIGALLISDPSHRLFDHRPNYLTYCISRSK